MKPTTGFFVPLLAMNSAAWIFALPADLADHDDAFGFRVGQQHLERLDEVHALHRIASDADAGGLAQPRRRRLRHRLIGQCAATD